MRDFGKSIGKEIRIENIAFDGLIPALVTGKVDMVMSSMTVTDARRETVDFSKPYANAMLALFLHSKKSLRCSPSPELLGNKFQFFFFTRPEILPFCTLDFVVATLVAMQV